MLSTVDVDKRSDEDEAGDVQVIAWRDLFAMRRRELGSQVAADEQICRRKGVGQFRRCISVLSAYMVRHLPPGVQSPHWPRFLDRLLPHTLFHPW